MPVFANGGTRSRATTSSARTSPRASRRANGRGVSGATAPRIVACASSSAITPTGVPHRPTRGDVLAQPLTEGRSEVTAVERELDVRAQEIDLLTDVVSTAPAMAAEHALVLEQHGDRVGELQLAAAPRHDEVERGEDLGREHVATDDRQVRRRLVARRLLDDATDLDDAVGQSGSGPRRTRHRFDAAVRRDLVRRDFRERDTRPALLLVYVEHQAQQRTVIDHE